MSSTLKRELLFWLASAAVIGAYAAGGLILAPDVPPEPQLSASPDGPVPFQTAVDRIRKDHQAQQDWKRSVGDRNRFLANWYRGGAVAGIVLVLVYTWWRPPWRTGTIADDGGSSRAPSRPSSPAVSRHLVLGVAVILLLVMLALLAAALLSS
ncbi:MAG: hypothetical protein ACE5KM_20385 [Planctomycetaceae bacterium]